MSVLFAENRLCEVGYFPDMAGYRKFYGNCTGNHLDSLIGISMASPRECAEKCDNDADCGGFTVVNTRRLYKK